MERVLSALATNDLDRAPGCGDAADLLKCRPVRIAATLDPRWMHAFLEQGSCALLESSVKFSGHQFREIHQQIDS